MLEKRYRDLTHEQLRGMINSVIFREGADPAEFLYEIAEVEGGYDSLVDYLSDRTQMVRCSMARTNRNLAAAGGAHVSANNSMGYCQWHRSCSD